MPLNQKVTARRNRRQLSDARPRSGSTPTIIGVVQGGIGSLSEVTITFDVPVMIWSVPFEWATIGLSPNLFAQSIVSNSGTEVVLDFGEDVTGLTGINVPQGNSAAVTTSGKAVPPGNYLTS